MRDLSERLMLFDVEQIVVARIGKIMLRVHLVSEDGVGVGHDRAMPDMYDTLHPQVQAICRKVEPGK